ncbi:conserved oligomeric Golgi complex subunit 3 [Arctopsyche grandis]|uniref:conserved oligomeric Golgi complex subunit 3 n=1 Tax=Arctopsyche grandis TaxID=121162 RepID=UPI00406D9A0B
MAGGGRRLVQWEVSATPLAPLTSLQRDLIFDLADIYSHYQDSSERKTSDTIEPASLKKSTDIDVESTQQFLQWYDELECGASKGDDSLYLDYYKQLEERKNECGILLQQVDAALQNFNKLSDEYNLVSTKTNALHVASAQLIADQSKHFNISTEIKNKMHFFSQVENLSQRLNSPTLSVSSESFFTILSKIDECMTYLKENSNYKESNVYLIKYRHCLSRAFNLIRSYVNHVLTHATEQILTPRPQLDADSTQIELLPLNPTADTAFALFFGKFQAAAPKLKNIFKEIEDRVEKSEEYANLLQECQQCYLTQRAQVIWSGVEAAVKELTDNHKGDHCTLMRSACSFLMHISQDEWDLFYQFFSQSSPLLTSYLGGLCNTLYDTLRPYVIHINHLETLAELCTILKIEMLEEHVNSNPEPLAAFGRVAAQLLQDSQERLAYRAHVCLRSDVLNYKPAAGDLAYPEKLLMMEQIALSLQEQPLKRSDSHNSMVSVGSVTSQEVANINSEGSRQRLSVSSSPADLHGMWYPGVRRTLATLSRLYRCLERPVFQGLSQEALVLCVTSVANAAQQISSKKTVIDGELFQIKHLLILREQIAPFQVDFTVKETTLDFSKVKTAALGLIQKRNQLFSMNSNNALLEFLLDGTPMVREHLLDSRKEVDRRLKSSCESFIKHSTEILILPLVKFLENAQKMANDGNTARVSPEQIAAILLETQRLIKANLSPLQRSMQLYLTNKETEFILFRPIRNNVVGNYIQIEQILNNGSYSPDDMIIASCPTAEQVSVLLSSASLLTGNEPVMPYSSNKRKISTVKSTSNAVPVSSADPNKDNNKSFII